MPFQKLFMKSYEEISFVCDMTVSSSRSASYNVTTGLWSRRSLSSALKEKRLSSTTYATVFFTPEAPSPLAQIWGRLRFLKIFMPAHALSFMFDALLNLEKAVEAAAKSIKTANVQDRAVLNRITSYKEIIRRQHSLLGELQRASAREDWKEVSRITGLVHGSSLMIKVDAGFLLSNLKAKVNSSGASSN